jgi:branched-chain amino acid transport system ATP-binding protein
MAAKATTTTRRKTAAKKPAASKRKTPAKKLAAKKTAAKQPATRKAPAKTAGKRTTGYHMGDVDTVISVEDVTRQVEAIAEEVKIEQLDKLVKGEPYLTIDNLRSGYGKMQILHDFNLRVGRKQSLCLIGPNGAGKSTILHSIFGFNNIFSGNICVRSNGEMRDITRLSPNQKLKQAGIAYILQDKSVFPSMTVEENLWMGGFLMDKPARAKEAAERVFDKYPRLAARRKHQAKVLSGGERRLLEISRALVMGPEVLLVDEPSIGLEPRFIDMVFEILYDLQHNEGKTILMVEQNAKKGLEFADIGYVLVSGVVAVAGEGDKLLKNPEVGRLFLGG